MKELSEILKRDTEKTLDKLIALDELGDLVESIDNAKNLFMVDGVAPLIQCIRGSEKQKEEDVDDDDALRKRAAEVFATVVQNNPRAQQWAREGGATLNELVKALGRVSEESEKAIQLLYKTPGDSTLSKVAERYISTRASLVTAISALVRDNAANQRDLVSSNAGIALFELLKPIATWPLFSLSSTLPMKTLLCGRRLIRKTLYSLRHLCLGSQSDAVMATVLLNGSEGEITTTTVTHHLLAASLAWPTSSSDVSDLLRDIPDIRENALSVLIALASETRAFGGVVEDARDERKPRSLFAGNVSLTNTSVIGSSTSNSQPLLLQDSSQIRPVLQSSSELSIATLSDVFVPSLEWQEIRQGQRIPAGLEVKLDLSTGKQFARQMSAEERAGYRSDFSQNSSSTSGRSGSRTLAVVPEEIANRERSLRTQQRNEEENAKTESVAVAVRKARCAALLHTINLVYKETGGVLQYIQNLKSQANLSRSVSLNSSSLISSSSDEARFAEELASILQDLYEGSSTFSSTIDSRNGLVETSMD
jgi:hypothetical protein